MKADKELTTKGTYKKVDLSVNGDKVSQVMCAQRKRKKNVQKYIHIRQ